MILNEQKYTNLNKIYYHGSRTGKLEKEDSNFDLFYLTHNFEYAALFACDSDNPLKGKVFQFTLKQGLNIFNAYSKKDVDTLKLFIFKNKIEIDKKWYSRGLQTEDWNYIFGYTPYKHTLIDCIQNCGFDGFFNYEWTETYKKKFDIERGEKMSTALSIGVFDIEKLTKCGVLSYDDYFQFEGFKKEYNEERNTLINKAVLANERNRDVFETARDFIVSHCPFLTERDLEFVVKNINNFENGKDYERDKTLDIIYEKCKSNGIVFDDRFGGWVLSEEKDVLYFSNQKHLSRLNEMYHLKNFEKDFIDSYNEFRKNLEYRL